MPLHPKGSFCIRPGLYEFPLGVRLERTGYRDAPWCASVEYGGRSESHHVKRFRDGVDAARRLVATVERWKAEEGTES